MRLVDRNPVVSAAEMLAELVPPREFESATFESYIPDEQHPSQAAAVSLLRQGFAARKRKDAPSPGFYLDGGFGVGKTHLLAALYREVKGKKLFGSFLAYTALIGAIGFNQALALLKKYDFLAIDEFELDDPGNTMLLSRLINDLGAQGVRFAATSNTPPDALGAGRFAAEDFQREILGIGAHFQIVTIDGEDYRHRHSETNIPVLSDSELVAWIDVQASGTLDDFSNLVDHLATLHPSKYHKLLDGVDAVSLAGVKPFTDQAPALRFVAFVDRAYENQIKMRASGISMSLIFPDVMLHGAYQKKYRRALSRLASMSE
jgi:cell division protein ZapE